MIQGGEKTCCFIGHRKIERTAELERHLKDVIYALIDRGIGEFVFGDHSEFNDLCYESVTEIKRNFRISKEYISERHIPMRMNIQTDCL